MIKYVTIEHDFLWFISIKRSKCSSWFLIMFLTYNLFFKLIFFTVFQVFPVIILPTKWIRHHTTRSQRRRLKSPVTNLPANTIIPWTRIFSLKKFWTIWKKLWCSYFIWRSINLSLPLLMRNWKTLISFPYWIVRTITLSFNFEYCCFFTIYFSLRYISLHFLI